MTPLLFTSHSRCHAVIVVDRDAKFFYDHLNKELVTAGLDVGAEELLDIIEGYKGEGYTVSTDEEQGECLWGKSIPMFSRQKLLFLFLLFQERSCDWRVLGGRRNALVGVGVGVGLAVGLCCHEVPTPLLYFLCYPRLINKNCATYLPFPEWTCTNPTHLLAFPRQNGRVLTPPTFTRLFQNYNVLTPHTFSLFPEWMSSNPPTPPTHTHTYSSFPEWMCSHSRKIVSRLLSLNLQ